MVDMEEELPRYAKICKQCGTVNEGGDALPGSGWIELLLWLCYIVPGAIYSIWRRTKKNGACTACGSRDIVQVGTPIGAQLLRQYHPGASIDAATPMQAPVTHRPAPSGARIAKAIGAFVLAVFVLAFVGGLINRFG